jgi:hypothetical protein
MSRDCDAVLIPTKITQELTYHQKLALVKSIRSQKALDAASSSGLGVSIGWLKLEGNYDDFDKRREQFLSEEEFYLDLDEAQRIAVSFLPDNVTNAWRDCMLNSEGVLMYAKNVSKESVSIEVRWSPSTRMREGVLENVQVIGSSMSEEEFRNRLPEKWVGKENPTVILKRIFGKELRIAVNVSGTSDHIYLPPFREEPIIKKERIEFSACAPAPASRSAFNNLVCFGYFGDLARNNGKVFQENRAEYRFVAKGPGTYMLKVSYGSEVSRPVKILVNDKEFSDALGEVAGTWWNPSEYKSLGHVDLRSGENVLLIENKKDDKGNWTGFPHLSKFRFEPVEA